MLFVIVHAADTQDRDGAPDLITAIRYRFPWLRHIFADGGYAGVKLRTALDGNGDWTVEIIKRSDTAKGFEVLPRRWVGSGPSPGSGDAAGWQKTGSAQSKAPPLGPTSPPSEPSSEGSQLIAMFHELLNQRRTLRKEGDPAEVLQETVDFEYFRSWLVEGLGYGDGSKGGRPPFDPVMMFKALILHIQHNLSDARMEFMIRDRLSWMRFLATAVRVGSEIGRYFCL